MRSKLLNEMIRLNKELSKNSWANYLILLDNVVSGLRDDVTWKKSLLGFIRRREISNMLLVADSLTEQEYVSATDHFVANQIASLIRKYPFPSDLTPYAPELEAKSKFIRAELNCKSMNEYFVRDDSNIRQGQDWFYHSMRKFISYAIGDSPVLPDIYGNCDFGPGASLGVHGSVTHLAQKFASDWSVSSSALPYARAALVNHFQIFNALCDEDHESGYSCYDPTKAEDRISKIIKRTEYNKIAFVPKTAKTHRAIAVEPLLNTFVQKGADAVLRRKLLRIGIDLSDQSINQRLAREGSVDDSEDGFVTIDLSSASDSISIGLARLLLPPDWFDFLNCIRSHSYEMDGERKVYHKFCSMGNGFCFPLETLLFVAACHATGCGVPGVDFNVYGDDIIVRGKHASELIHLLRWMGFETNRDKTFLRGPFRESCGSDWFNGEDVRPFIFDFALDSLENIFKFLNLTQRSDRTSNFFSEVNASFKKRIPRNLYFARPYPGQADTGVTVALDEFMTTKYAKYSLSIQNWRWLELQHVAVADRNWSQLRFAKHSQMMAALRGASSRRPFTVRRKTSTKVVKK